MLEPRDAEYHTFSFRSTGTCGQEIVRNSDGVVVAWTIDSVWARKFVACLERDVAE